MRQRCHLWLAKGKNLVAMLPPLLLFFFAVILEPKNRIII